jgi:hypothetical protein
LDFRGAEGKAGSCCLHVTTCGGDGGEGGDGGGGGGGEGACSIAQVHMNPSYEDG